MWRRIPAILRWVVVTLGVVVLTSFSVDATLNNSLSQTALGIFASKLTDTNCPAGMLMVQASGENFCIDTYEASPGDGCKAKSINNIIDSRINLEDSGCSPVSKKDSKPWLYVTYHQAQELCARRSTRLPTHSEWYQAALGTPDSRKDFLCNVNSNQIQKTGNVSTCVAGSGAYDMIGNVWEWIDGSVTDRVYQTRVLPPSGYVADADAEGLALNTTNNLSSEDFHEDYFWSKESGTFGMIRGGYYGSKSDAGLYSINAEIVFSFSGEAVGFRCVKEL